MIPPSNHNKCTMIDDLDCSAVRVGNDNDMEMISINNACRPIRTRSLTRRDETSGDALEEYKDSILSTSAVGSCVEDTRSRKEVDEVNVFLQEDVMRVKVASVSGAYEPEIF